MGHSIAAVIGAIERVELLLGPGDPAPTTLDFDLVIAPLGHAQIDRLTQLAPGAYHDGFRLLSTGLEGAFLAAADRRPLAYVETGYFGGVGSQGAAVFANGAVLMRTAGHAAGPINAALRLLGVVAGQGRDEFDTLGLGRFRSLEVLGLVADED